MQPVGTAIGVFNGTLKDTPTTELVALDGFVKVTAGRLGVVTRTKFGPREDWKSQLRFRPR